MQVDLEQFKACDRLEIEDDIWIEWDTRIVGKIKERTVFISTLEELGELLDKGERIRTLCTYQDRLPWKFRQGPEFGKFDWLPIVELLGKPTRIFWVNSDMTVPLDFVLYPDGTAEQSYPYAFRHDRQLITKTT